MTAAQHRFHLDKRPHAIAVRQGILCATTPDGIFLWNVASGQLLHTIMDLDQGSHQGVIEFALSPDGKLLATGVADLTTKAYSTETGQRLARLSRLRPEYYNAAEEICFSPDGRFLITAMGRTITVWNSRDWQEVHRLKGHTSKVHLLQEFSDESSFGKCVAFAHSWPLLRDRRRRHRSKRAEKKSGRRGENRHPSSRRTLGCRISTFMCGAS